MSTEIYKRHRPRSFDTVVGQTSAVKVLKGFVDKGTVPHCILMHGPSGCGKTTLARILRRKVQCGKGDFAEINCADFRGIDMVRDIRRVMGLSPMRGKARMWLIDEAHKLSGDAQNAFLKMLEDTPDHVYFVLATTEPNKLLQTIRTRCTDVKLSPIKPPDLAVMIKRICKEEKIKADEEVLDKLVEESNGSARQACVFLNTIQHLSSTEDQLEAIASASGQQAGIAVAQVIFRKGAGWADVVKVLKEVDEEPETIRRIVLGYATSILLGKSPLVPRAASVIEVFRDHWFDCGKAGLVASCYELFRK